MDRQMWCTKEDVLKDLEMANGWRGADLDEGYFVVGERPPPPRIENDKDDECKLLFGQAGTTQKLDATANIEPDLKGITNMLRMVQDYESLSDDDNTLENVKPNTKKDIIVISKLNPNVREFVPKTFQFVSSQTVTNTNDKVISTDIAAPDNDLEIKNKILNNKTSVTSVLTDSNSSLLETKSLPPILEQKVPHTNKKSVSKPEITKSLVKRKEIEEEAAKLKSEISAKEETFEDKQKTNVAVINLLKLYARSESTKPNKTIKLYTPEFFEKCSSLDFKRMNDCEDTDKSTETKTESKITSVPNFDVNNDEPHKNIGNESKLIDLNEIDRSGSVAKSADSSIKQKSSLPNVRLNNNVSPKEQKDETNKFGCATLNSKVHDVNAHDDHYTLCSTEVLTTTDSSLDENTNRMHDQDPEHNINPVIKESINKVNNWFYEKPYGNKEKPKSPVVYLDPVSYKRKDPTSCKSPSESDKKMLKPSDIGSYQPSKYADELLERFAERNKHKTPKLNIWEKLDADLKKKDLEIKNAMRNANTAAST